MKIHFSLIVAATLTTQVYVVEAEDTVTTEQNRLQGAWQATAVVDGGTPEYGDRVETLKLKIKGDHYIYDFGDHSFSATFTVDPTKSPKEMDVTFWEGPQTGKVMRALYSLQGEELKICTAMYKRPTAFVSTLEAQSILFTFQKDTPSKEITGAEILHFGIYSGSRLPALKNSKDTYTESDYLTAALQKETPTIPAVIGTKFGFEFIVHGNPTTKPVKLRSVYLSPPLTDPIAKRTVTQSEAPFAVKLENNKDVGMYYSLDNAWEVVPGTWTFQIFDHDKKLLEKTFTLVKP